MVRSRVIKRGLVLCALALALGIACGITSQAKTAGYRFTYKKVTVSMHGSASKLIKKVGKPLKKTAEKSCAYDGMDRTYTYKNFILYTYSNSNYGPEYIDGITFLTKKVKTKKGIRIGSSLKKLLKKYGTTKEKYGIYTYKKGKSKLQFEVTDDVVTNIRYVSLS